MPILKTRWVFFCTTRYEAAGCKTRRPKRAQRRARQDVVNNMAKISLNVGNVATLNITTKLMTDRCLFSQNNVTVMGIISGFIRNTGLVSFECEACYRQHLYVEKNMAENRMNIGQRGTLKVTWPIIGWTSAT